MHFWDYTIIIAYLLLAFGIGLYFRKRAGKSTEDFFLGGRNLPWYLAGLSMVATTFASDTPLAVTEFVRKDGISGNWIWWNMLAGGLFTTFFFARLWRRAGIITELELINIRYSGKAAQWLRGIKAVFYGLVMNIIIMGWVNLAMIKVLQTFYPALPIETLYLILFGLMLMTTIYAAVSGLYGVVFTDALQFCIAMASTVVLAFYVVGSEQVGGLSGLRAQLPEATLDFFPSISNTDTVGLTLAPLAFLTMVGLQWWGIWYPGNEPGGGGYIAQRMMAAKDEKHALGATLFFQIFNYALRPWPWILIGLASFVLYPGLEEGNYAAGFTNAMRDYLPTGLQGLLLVAFLAAYMSTISTHLNWGTSYLINDLYQPYLLKRDDQKKLVNASRILTFILLVISVLATLNMTSIKSAWEFLLQCGAGVGFVLILRWFWWRMNAWSEITATLVPFISFGVFAVLHQLVDDGDPEGFWVAPNTLLMGASVTIFMTLVVTFLTPATPEDKLRAFYQRVRPHGSWAHVRDAQGPLGAPLWVTTLAWLSGMMMVYGLMFGVGKLLLMAPNDALLWLGVSLLGGLALGVLVQRYRLFK
ncbi:MAG: sodium:solute symporter family protein [Bacteroidota bacterium]